MILIEDFEKETGEGIEQNHSGSNNGSRQNKEITKRNNPGNRKPRKEIRNHRCKHQQNTRDKISGAEDTIENNRTTVKENAKCKKLLIQKIQ